MKPRCKAKVVNGIFLGQLNRCMRTMKMGTKYKYCYQHRWMDKAELKSKEEG